MIVQRIATIPTWARITIPVVIIGSIAIYLGIGWYFSNKLLVRSPQVVEYDQTVDSIDADKFTISGSAYNVNGVIGAIASDGTYIGLMSAPLSKDDANKTSVRTFVSVAGTQPGVGDKISLQGNIWTTDPGTALGVDYDDVTYDSPLGPMSAWLIPTEGSTKWTIAVHGIGAPKQEMLRFIKPVQAAGNNMMIINYRGDVDNPKSPDGYTHLGDTEWQDLEAAVRYAKSKGATEIQLYGASLGGSITQNYLRRSTDAPDTNITKVILDSPALNWKEILISQAKRGGYPAQVVTPGMTVAQWRAKLKFSRITTVPADFRHKTLIFHTDDDLTIPIAGSQNIADTRPDLVKLVNLGGGGHVRSWNHDQQGYEAAVTDFLKD